MIATLDSIFESRVAIVSTPMHKLGHMLQLYSVQYTKTPNWREIKKKKKKKNHFAWRPLNFEV